MAHSRGIEVSLFANLPKPFPWLKNCATVFCVWNTKSFAKVSSFAVVASICVRQFHETRRTLHRSKYPMLRRFIFPAFGIFHLFACNAAKTISIDALVDVPPGVTSHFLFPTSGSNAEAYLIKPAGPGPFPLMILLHGHTLGSIGARSVVREAEAFANDLCYAAWPFRFPAMAQQKCCPGQIQKSL